MLLKLKAYRRNSASAPPTEITIAVDPFTIAHIEPNEFENDRCDMWCDGMDNPYCVAGTVDDIAERINASCAQVCSEIE